MTAFDLLSHLRSAGVTITIDRGKLRVSNNVPADLAGPLKILQSGVRALLLGVHWYGFRSATASHKDGRDNPLNPEKPLSVGIDLLCIEGGAGWNRISAEQMKDNPKLWLQPATRQKARAA